MPRYIIEEPERIVVRIDGVELRGWIDEEKACPKCGASEIYYETYDANFCPTCNVWLEQGCGDESCAYCRQRPEHPLPE
jgi:hypothetical protein